MIRSGVLMFSVYGFVALAKAEAGVCEFRGV